MQWVKILDLIILIYVSQFYNIIAANLLLHYKYFWPNYRTYFPFSLSNWSLDVLFFLFYFIAST